MPHHWPANGPASRIDCGRAPCSGPSGRSSGPGTQNDSARAALMAKGEAKSKASAKALKAARASAPVRVDIMDFSSPEFLGRTLGLEIVGNQPLRDGVLSHQR